MAIKENNLNTKDISEVEEDIDQDMPRRRSMGSQSGLRIKPVVLGTVLVVCILCAYVFHFSPTSKLNAADKQHADWLKQMQRQRTTNDSLPIQDKTRVEFAHHSDEHSRVSMVLPADIPEDIHKPQTLPQRYDSDNDIENRRHRMTLKIPNKSAGDGARVDDDYDDDDYDDNYDDDDDYDNDNKDKEKNDIYEDSDFDDDDYDDAKDKENAKKADNDYDDEEEDFDEDYDEDNEETNKIQAVGIKPAANIESYRVQQTNVPNAGEQLKEANAPSEPEQKTLMMLTLKPQSNAAEVDKPPYLKTFNQEIVRNRNVNPVTTKIMQGNVNIQRPIVADSFNPAARSEYNRNVNIYPQAVQSNGLIENPSQFQQLQANLNIQRPNAVGNVNPAGLPEYNRNGNIYPQVVKTNGNIENPSQFQQAEKRDVYGNILPETNRQLSGGINQGGVVENKNGLLLSRQGRSDDLEMAVYRPLKDVVGMNNQIQPNKESHTLTLQHENIEKNYRTYEDMNAIVKNGSPTSDDANKEGWKWNVNENTQQGNLYNVNDATNKYGNLVMQLNNHAEPVTGTKLLRPVNNPKIEYPSYLTPIDWKSSVMQVKPPVFECVPMRTIYYYIRVCIHPQTVNSEISTKLKNEASWEFNALRDMQIALFEHKDSMLLDLGASFGVFSLAAAALNRKVVAVEPYPSHIQVFRQSVLLNQFADHITLFQAVVSDRRGKVLIKRLGDNVDNVYIQTVEDDEPSTDYNLVVNTVTLDDIEKVLPSRTVVLKIDTPGFVKKALEYSHFFFKYLYVTHVFMHWDVTDKDLCRFLVRFFIEQGYQPYSDLGAQASQLKIDEAEFWTNDIVIWKL